MVIFDVHNEVFDPFKFGFTFSVGFPEPLDKRIGSFTLAYTTKEWINDVRVPTSKTIPLRSCDVASGYPLSTKALNISMMCHDEIPVDSRSLTGDYYSDNFSYLKVSLSPCKSVKKGDCATEKEVAAFYARNPKL